ncbi:spike base protein, RCAP_Rcc01079 family [Rhodovulum sulfidophilum]|uniref:spike base protein, RCAP_Rcc01079 family n=1 Tax=Rhodovulum sulfidophilum TaxID=35806 RepID=UPI000951480E|nr:hypothetical protein [Rhodovulum sulfidophilum]OLS51856.1 hypothetical protein BV392_07450 [Rhodovulum sulfidophilum]
MADPYPGMSVGSTSPAVDWSEITPSDSANLATVPRALDCAVSGDVVIVSASGNEITITLTAGAPYPVRPVRVKATGTTATGIIGMW